MGTIFNTYVLREMTILVIINIAPRYSAGVIFNTRVFLGACFSSDILPVSRVYFLVPVLFVRVV